VIKETEGLRSRVGPTQQDIVQVVLTAIRESPDYLDPDVLARDLVRSLGYPSRLITEVMHSLGISSVASLVNRVRVDHAIALMREAPHTVSQDIIYRSVGFTSRRTYNRVFKAVTKVSPGEYLDRLNGSVDGITEFVDEGPRPD
jgi:transcriptional regulator GlxA family with amidase domain